MNRFLYNTEGGAAGSGAAGGQEPPPAGTGAQGAQGTGAQTGNASGTQSQNNGTATFDLAYVQSLRNESAEHRTARTAAEQKLAEKEREANEYKPFKEKYEQIVTARRTELIARLPEAKREGYKDFPIEHLEMIVKDFIAENGGVSNSPGSQGSSGAGGAPTTLKGMTDEQQVQLMKTNPALFNQLLEADLKKG